MKKLKALQIAIVILSVTISAILFTSCQKEPSPLEPEGTSLPKFSLPAGATFQSATFYVYVMVPSGQNIDIHRITTPWDEDVVNWANFGSSYALEVEGTFNASFPANQWRSADVSSLVGSWLDGTNPNYGLLLAQDEQTYPRTEYRSMNYSGAVAAYLEIFYTLNGVLESDTTRCIQDTYIYELDPTRISGHRLSYFTGWANNTDLEKQALIQFDLEYTPPPQYDCETAYAYGGNVATCFLDLSPINANNWGWTNYIGEGSYDWPIYAGAGQCDISKGTLVGNLSAEYFGGTVTITYEIDPEFELGDTHVWVGTTPLPIKNGKYTTAPGQFNHNGENPVVVSGLSGNIYIAAHSGVCWEVQ